MKARKRVLTTIALIGPVVIASAVAAISYVVYHQVSAEMVTKTEEILHERLQFVDQTITDVFTEAVRLTNILSREPLSAETHRNHVQALAQLKVDIPACLHVWMTFLDGTALYGPMTNARYLEQNRGWKAYESQGIGQSMTLYDAAGTASIAGKPFRDELNLDTILPVIVYRFKGVQRIATVFIAIDITELLNMYLRDLSSTMGRSGSEFRVSVYGQDGNLIETTMNLPLVKVQPLSPATRLILSDQEMHNLYASGRLSVRNHDYVELFRRDSDSGLIFSSRVSRSSIGESVTRITLNILGIGLFSIVVIVLLGLLLVRTLSRMRTFEEKQIRARLEMLQAKMNPHFLFNTLDSMIGVVLDNDRDTLLKILRSLSYMLHMSVRKKEDIITLADELRYITSYVELQRVRYPDSFDFTLNADKALLGLYVYRFSIQPLVENCFVHGVAEQPSRHICITVTVEKKDGALFVTVTDNGPGCTPEMRKRLTKIFHDDKMISNNGIGLSAVHSRIHTMHGKRYGLRLLPPGESFGIQAVLPVIRKRG